MFKPEIAEIFPRTTPPPIIADHWHGLFIRIACLTLVLYLCILQIVPVTDILRAQQIQEDNEVQQSQQSTILQRFKSVSIGNLLDLPGEDDKKSIKNRMRMKCECWVMGFYFFKELVRPEISGGYILGHFLRAIYYYLEGE